MIRGRKENTDGHEINRNTKDVGKESEGKDISNRDHCIFIRDPAMDAPLSKLAALVDELSYNGHFPELICHGLELYQAASSAFLMAKHFMNGYLHRQTDNVISRMSYNIDLNPGPREDFPSFDPEDIHDRAEEDVYERIESYDWDNDKPKSVKKKPMGSIDQMFTRERNHD